jgi:hypothetical protein
MHFMRGTEQDIRGLVMAVIIATSERHERDLNADTLRTLFASRRIDDDYWEDLWSTATTSASEASSIVADPLLRCTLGTDL